MVSGLVTSPCDQLRIFSGLASWILMASKSAIGPVSSKGLERNILGVSLISCVCRLQHVAAVTKSVCDDLGRIAMPVVLMLLLIFRLWCYSKALGTGAKAPKHSLPGVSGLKPEHN